MQELQEVVWRGVDWKQPGLDLRFRKVINSHSEPMVYRWYIYNSIVNGVRLDHLEKWWSSSMGLGLSHVWNGKKCYKPPSRYGLPLPAGFWTSWVLGDRFSSWARVAGFNWKLIGKTKKSRHQPMSKETRFIRDIWLYMNRTSMYLCSYEHFCAFAWNYRTFFPIASLWITIIFIYWPQ